MRLVKKEIHEIAVPSMAALFFVLVINGGLHEIVTRGVFSTRFFSQALFFGIIAFTAFLGAHANLGDRERGSHRFLCSLPQSTCSIWTQKTAVSLFVCLLFYPVYYVNQSPSDFSLIPALFLTSFAFSNLAGHFFARIINAGITGFGIALLFIILFGELTRFDFTKSYTFVIAFNLFILLVALVALIVSYNLEKKRKKFSLSQ